MPFQNTLSIFNNKSTTPVLFVSAGEDIFSICDPNVNLTATVILDPLDNTAHTYLWEQVSGDAVLFTSPTALISVAYISASYTDVILKFTVDKNTQNEISDTITIFRTPTSFSPITGSTAGTATYSNRAVTLSFASNVTAVNTCAYVSSYELTWNTPLSIEYLVEYQAQRKPGLGPWITFDTILPNSPNISYTPNVTDSFRILSIHSDGDNYPSNMVYDVNTRLAGLMLDQIDQSADVLSSISVYEVDDLSLITNNDGISDINQSSDILSSISLYTVDDLSLITNNDGISDFNQSSDILSSTSFYEIDDLTGGQIGG